jgi:hypothetical protein
MFLIRMAIHRNVTSIMYRHKSKILTERVKIQVLRYDSTELKLYNLLNLGNACFPFHLEFLVFTSPSYEPIIWNYNFTCHLIRDWNFVYHLMKEHKLSIREKSDENRISKPKTR